MPVRKVGEPLAIPRAIEVTENPVEEAEEQAYLNVTDSAETKRVRIPSSIGEIAEIVCAVTSRPLTDKEQKALRNEHTVPEDAAVTPQRVICSAVAPNGERFTPEIVETTKGLYTVSVALTSRGGWFYEFEADGLYSGTSTKRAIEAR